MEHLKDFRIAIGFTHQQMADKLQISKSFYEKIESGEKLPGREVLRQFKKVFPYFNVNIFLEDNHT